MSPTGGSSSKGAGITKTIREQLNFTDNARWKEFSNRRLELIDKFNLSSKKASEQDNDIHQIATLLRDEFGFPINTVNEFDKLVRAAVQSVRRNRKRSSRARINHNRFVIVEDGTSPKSEQSPKNEMFNHHQPSTSSPIPLLPHLYNDESSSLPNKSIFNSLLSNVASPSSSSSMSTSPKTTHNTILPSINSVLTSTNLPSANTTTTTTTTTTVNPPLLATDSTFNPSIPQSHAKQKLLKQIQNSKTCLLLSDNSPNIHEQNLLTLGQSIITASISFVLERFFQDISKESISYLSEKLNDCAMLSKIIKSLGFDSIEVMNLSEIQAMNLFYKLVGCCVKDFGFDVNCYNLSEIFHEVILNEYPLIGTQITKISKESLFMPLLPMIPKDANKETSKTVKLKFNDKLLEFKFFPLSNASPTFLELVENGKTAFGIIENNDHRSFRLKHDGVDVQDQELDKLFKDLSLASLELELYEVGQGTKFTPLL